ncbi:MAG: class I SAM-dependent methyltransferase [Hyphomonadaceae bacterium]
MPHSIKTLLLALALASCATQSQAPQETASAADPAANAAAALADARRPEEDRARDALRHPAEMLAFANIGPGARVADLLPGGGYFTRIFAVAVGPEGRVYPIIRPDGVSGQYETPILAVAAQYPNAVMARENFNTMTFPEPLDVFFTAQNYHDLHIARYNLGSIADVNRAVFNALKPGGLYVIIDHTSQAGTEHTVVETLHRIDPAVVRREVEAAGFVYDGESNVLDNPADPLTANVFDPAIRGHTDQFAMRFRKPE